MRGLIIALSAASAAAFHLPVAPSLRHTARAATIVAQSQAEIDECVVDAENAEEIAACQEPMADPAASLQDKVAAATSAVKPAADKTTLMGASESVEQCISEAESGEEAAECRADYDALVSDTTVLNEGADLTKNIGIFAVAAAILVFGRGGLDGLGQ